MTWTCPYCQQTHELKDLGPVSVALCSSKDKS